MNTFLLDKEYSRKYEIAFAEKFNKYMDGVKINDGRSDDLGVDISINYIINIDVKCYRKPLFIKSFDGAFIETYLPKSGRKGWYKDTTKLTNAYIFVIDAEEDRLHYTKAYYIAKCDLDEAVKHAERECDLKYKKTASGWGFILPYKYLAEYGEELWLEKNLD